MKTREEIEDAIREYEGAEDILNYELGYNKDNSDLLEAKRINEARMDILKWVLGE